MSEVCSVCMQKPAQIMVTGEGDLCADCYNQRMMEKFGIKNVFDYERKISVSDDSGQTHIFEIQHLIHGAIVSWHAREIDGDYTFRLISDVDENGSKVAERFIEKIIAGVKNKILSIESESDASLSDKGDIHIDYDEERDSMIFVIDGKRVLPDELAKYLSCFEGFNLQYAIRDESEPLLGKDEYLIPVKITKDTLVEELEDKINMYSDGGFLSYKIIPLFQDCLYGIIDKLKVLYRYKREDAIEAGKEMIRMLEVIEHDDDFFPEAERQLITRIITKYGPVEE